VARIVSPKLLMLSGIGDSEPLQALHVRVAHALPGVGAGLVDHSAAMRISGHRGRPFQPIVDGISDERGRCFRLIVDDVSA
jgi:choline dehydrogenase-like flavoprotein